MKRVCPLPEEVMVEILLRLPPKSLMRLKCVCKSWNALINDPSFVTNHLHQNMKSNKMFSSTTLLLRWTRQGLSLHDFFNCTFHEDDRHDNQVLSMVTIFHKDNDDHDHDVDDYNDQIPCVVEELSPSLAPNEEGMGFLPTFVGSHCNGIICLVDCFPLYKDIIFLCNPSLREFKVVSAPCLPPKFTSTMYGFGYDSRADDYKCLRIISSNHAMLSEADVYSLGTNSWREIKMDMKVRCYKDHRKGVYFKSVYYWWITAMPDYKDIILSFNMCEEEFQSILLPNDVQRFNSEWKSVAVWNESLVLLFSHRNSWFSTSFEMWVMVENSGDDDEGFAPWIKHLTIGPLIGIHSPVAFWTDEELLMDTRDGGIVSYNISTGKIRKLPIQGTVIPGSTYADFFQKSLVSVKGGNMLHQLGNLAL